LYIRNRSTSAGGARYRPDLPRSIPRPVWASANNEESGLKVYLYFRWGLALASAVLLAAILMYAIHSFLSTRTPITEASKYGDLSVKGIEIKLEQSKTLFTLGLAVLGAITALVVAGRE